MNIKRAKQEIKDAVEAYLLKDEYGTYEIPVVRQRPILLLGAPGIGKTHYTYIYYGADCQECGIGLVATPSPTHTAERHRTSFYFGNGIWRAEKGGHGIHHERDCGVHL